MKLTLVSIDKATGIIHVASDGDITMGDFREAGKNPLETVLGSNWATNSVMLDLRRTSFIDSSAIGWLLECQKTFKTVGGKMAIHSATPRVRDVFDLLRIRKVLNIMDNEPEAVAVLSGNGEAK